MAIRIDCIHKTDRYNPHERIHNVGGPNPDGTRWYLSQDEAIRGIESGQYSFYAGWPPGQRVQLIVARSQYGRKYLKTVADRTQPNNLLALPEC